MSMLELLTIVVLSLISIILGIIFIYILLTNIRYKFMEEVVTTVSVKYKEMKVGQQIISLIPARAGNFIGMLPTVISSPDCWKLAVEINNKIAWISVSKDFYDNVNVEDTIYVNCNKRLFSKKLTIKSVFDSNH